MGLNGRVAEIVTVWIILAVKAVPRFVTAYPKDWRMRFHAFVTASGRTQALVMLATASIRPVGSKDILAVRHFDAA